jgi:hypothetical protein
MMRGFRSRVRSFLLGYKGDKPVIVTPWGEVTEAARLRAALNMKEDPQKRAAVEAILAKQLGSVAKGLAEARRRYPECYSEE